MTKQTLETIVRSFNSASNDVTRYHINHVKVTSDKETITVEATDGFVLSTCRVQDPELAELIRKDTFLVSPDQLPALKLILKSLKSYPSIPVKREGEKISVGHMELNGCVVELKRDKELSMTYPNTSQLKPKYSTETIRVGLNAELLMDLAKSLCDQKQKHIILTISQDSLSPITVQAGENDGVIMPIRIDKMKGA